MELVVGISLITVVIGAIAVITTYSSRNSQFSKNQAQATKLAQENIDVVITIGDASKIISDTAKSKGVKGIYHFENNFGAVEKLKSILKTGDTILVKGSRRMKMEEIVGGLTSKID